MASTENCAPAQQISDATSASIRGKAKSRTEMLREWREAKRGAATSKPRFALQTIASGVSVCCARVFASVRRLLTPMCRPRAQNKAVQQGKAAKAVAGRGRHRAVLKSVAPSEARDQAPHARAPKSPAQALRDRIRSVRTHSAAKSTAVGPQRSTSQERAAKPASRAEALRSRVRSLNVERPKPRNLYVGGRAGLDRRGS